MFASFALSKNSSKLIAVAVWGRVTSLPANVPGSFVVNFVVRLVDGVILIVDLVVVVVL